MRALARSTDPSTSHIAAAHAAGFSASHRGMILTALEQHGSMTAHEISKHVCSLLPHQILKRLSELSRMGLIVLTGETRQSTGKMQARVWRIV